MEKRFCHCIIRAIASATHAGRDVVVGQQLLEGMNPVVQPILLGGRIMCANREAWKRNRLMIQSELKMANVTHVATYKIVLCLQFQKIPMLAQERSGMAFRPA